MERGTSNNETSLRDEVRGGILDLIGHMDFTYSTRLLSENQLAARLQVSRSTIRTVLAELESEGKIIRRHGSGTYVNPPALTMKATLYPSVSMYEIIKNNGLTPEVKVFSVESVPAGSTGAPLGLLPQEKMLEMRSCYYGDGQPCMYCVDYMANRLYHGVDWMGREGELTSLHQYIRDNTGIILTWDIIRIRGAHTGEMPELKAFFRVPDGEIKPLARLDIRNFDQNNETSLLGKIYVDTDIINLAMVRDLSKKSIRNG